MYEKLVERLRKAAGPAIDFPDTLYDEAADAIDELDKLLDGVSADNDSLCEKIERMQKPRWIPVTEQLPEDGSDILAVQSCCGEVRIIPANYDRGVWYDCIFNRIAEHITHWMPLPEPPKEET